MNLPGNTHKKYILFGPAYGIGGWQLYINARCKHLIENKIDSCLIYPPDTGGDKIKLDYIAKMKRVSLEQIEPYWYRKKQISNTIMALLDAIEYRNGDEVFIESTCIIYSFWGELIAEATRGQNFCYLLHSHTKGFPVAWQKFFSFKYDQGLIAGQTEITLPDLFEGFREIKGGNRAIYAQWEDPICDEREDCAEYMNLLRRHMEQGYKIIGYFGVLRKPHFMLLCDFMVHYSKRYAEHKFLFVAIGSSGESDPEQKLYEIPEESDNCEVYNIPEMYPIPRGIFQMLDICLASWGSSVHAATACERTIRIYDDVHLIPQGVIGINLHEPYHMQPPVNDNLDSLFDEILFGANYKGITYVLPEHVTMSSGGHSVIDSKMQPFVERDDGKIYYDIHSIPFNGGISKAKYISYKILGVPFTRSLIRMALRIKTKIAG